MDPSLFEAGTLSWASAAGTPSLGYGEKTPLGLVRSRNGGGPLWHDGVCSTGAGKDRGTFMLYDPFSAQASSLSTGTGVVRFTYGKEGVP